jgi:hypothetical protein
MKYLASSADNDRSLSPPWLLLRSALQLLCTAPSAVAPALRPPCRGRCIDPHLPPHTAQHTFSTAPAVGPRLPPPSRRGRARGWRRERHGAYALFIYGSVHPAYNPPFSACSQNNIFLSQRISQQCFLVGLSAQPNGAYAEYGVVR